MKTPASYRPPKLFREPRSWEVPIYTDEELVPDAPQSALNEVTEDRAAGIRFGQMSSAASGLDAWWLSA